LLMLDKQTLGYKPTKVGRDYTFQIYITNKFEKVLGKVFNLYIY